MLKRLITALVVIPPFLLLVRFGPPHTLAVLVTVTAVLGLYEFYQLTLPRDGFMVKVGGILFGVILCILFECSLKGLFTPFLFLLLFVLFFVHLLYKGELSLVPKNVGISVLGIIYIPYLLSHITLINKLPEGVFWVLVLLAAVWIGDTFALLIGTWWGKRKLSPRISPNKTVEGFIACFFGAVLAVFACKALFLQALPPLDAVAVGVGIALFGQLGDLSESMIKRGAKTKDSGSLFPGHGGMLDRLDSFLFAAPFLYYYLIFTKGL